MGGAGCAETVYVVQGARGTYEPRSTVYFGQGPPPGRTYEDVQVFIDRKVGRPAMVVGVLDFHSDADSEDKGFDELRAQAAALGADAVVSAEFVHGEDGGRSHLSGIAVRFLDH